MEIFKKYELFRMSGKYYSMGLLHYYVNKNKLTVSKVPLKVFDNEIKNTFWGYYINNDFVTISNDDMYGIANMIKTHFPNVKIPFQDYHQIEQSSLKYPIYVLENNIVLDGRHRLRKSVILNKPTVKCIYFKFDILDALYISDMMDDDSNNTELKKFYNLTDKEFISLYKKKFKKNAFF